MTSKLTREERVQALYDLKVGQVLSQADIENVKMLARMALAAMDSEAKESISFDEWSRKCALQITLCHSDFREKAQYIWDSARATQQPAPVVPEDFDFNRFNDVVWLECVASNPHMHSPTTSAIARVALELNKRSATMEAEPDRNPVLAYADSYRDMAKQGVESVPIWSVITDIERNIAPLYRHAQQPVVPDGLIAAVNRLLDSDGSRGCYSAIQCGDAHDEIERLLAAAPQEVKGE
ncbi:hypothetical protein [Klebsiella michiganensis]|uniref:hypothetical protein n=1 Tax=Klebsiella michiganensis TaxID=1134687 RepID=UPI001D0E28AE|nr:hypothetical protein [Klebsiella michiganensis]